MSLLTSTLCAVLETGFSQIVMCDVDVSGMSRRRGSYDPERPIPVDCSYVMMLLDNSDRFRREVRMTIAESRALAIALRIDATLPKHGGYRYPDYTRMILFLCTLSSAARYSQLSSLFQEAVPTITREYTYWINRMLEELDRPTSAYRIPGFWSSVELWSMYNNPPITSPQLLRRVIGAVDGTVAQIERPKDSIQEKAHYSYHKGYHGILFICIVDLNGRIIYLDHGSPCAHITEKMMLSQWTGTLLNGQELLGDLHYKDINFVRIPINKATVNAATSHQQRQWMIDYNKTLRHHRIIVEWTFARIKHTWARLLDVSRNDHVIVRGAMRVAALLANFLLVVRGGGLPQDFDAERAAMDPNLDWEERLYWY